jgi:hypothetical protein
MGFFPRYVRLEAFRCLSEGLKHSYDNWKMWQNYLYVAVVRAPLSMSALLRMLLTCAVRQDLGEFQASLQAITRLVDLVGPSVDIEVLRLCPLGLVFHRLLVVGHC